MQETKNYIEATPEEVAEWEKSDFFRSGNFNVLKLLVVYPAVVQILCLFAMFTVFGLNSVLFA